MIKRNIAIWAVLLAVAAAVSILGYGCRIAGNGNTETARGFKGSLSTDAKETAGGVLKSDGARVEDTGFSEPAAGAPLVSCLYFDEASFTNAAASAVIFNGDTTFLKGGIVPHHLLAGGMIASFWKTVSQRDYDLIVIIGPDHNRKGVSEITTITSGFKTIYGDVTANKKIANALIQENLVLEDTKVMEADHAISSHIPFISYYMPGTPVLPLLVKGSCSAGKIRELADYILKLTEDMDVLYVASMDFSHYLSLEEANEKDRYTEQVLASFDYDKIMEMTNDHLDSRPSALYLLHTMSALGSKSMTKWDHSNSDIISNTITGYTTSYFLFGFFEGPETQPDESGKLNIIAVGDIMLGRGVTSSLKAQRLDFIHPFTQVKSILDEGDIVFGNLEQPITESSESLNPEFKYILKSGTEAITGLSYAGFDVLSLANNHIMDYYETGLIDTLSILEKNNIAPSGAGCNLNDATKPVIIESNGIRVGFLAYTDMADIVHTGNPSIKFAAEQDKAGAAPLKP